MTAGDDRVLFLSFNLGSKAWLYSVVLLFLNVFAVFYGHPFLSFLCFFPTLGGQKSVKTMVGHDVYEYTGEQ